MDQQADRLLDGKIINITSNNQLLESRDKWRNRAFTNMVYTNCYETAIETLYDKYENNHEKIRLLDEINELYSKLEKTVEVIVNDW